MNYIKNIIAAINGQKVFIGSALTFILTVVLPSFGIHPSFSSDDALTWILSGLDYAGTAIGLILWIAGAIHKFKKGEINFIALLNALANKNR